VAPSGRPANGDRARSPQFAQAGGRFAAAADSVSGAPATAGPGPLGVPAPAVPRNPMVAVAVCSNMAEGPRRAVSAFAPSFLIYLHRGTWFYFLDVGAATDL
jgi:hypothetical protein